jgi:hypothetical protein
MRRWTILLTLALGLSMLSASAALAANGPGEGGGDATGQVVMTQTQAGTQTQTQAGTQTQTQAGTQTQTRTRTQDQPGPGECGEQAPCGEGAEQLRTRTMVQTQDRDGACDVEPDGPACEQVREMSGPELGERAMARIRAMLATDGAQYRALMQWVWAHVFGPFHAVFF